MLTKIQCMYMFPKYYVAHCYIFFCTLNKFMFIFYITKPAIRSSPDRVLVDLNKMASMSYHVFRRMFENQRNSARPSIYFILE